MKKDSLLQNFVIVIFVCALTLFTAAAIFTVKTVYRRIDRTGFIPHTETVDLYIKSEWLLTESRNCQGMQDRTADGSLQITALFCPTDTMQALPNLKAHQMPTKFYGRISRPRFAISEEVYKGNFQWRCVRKEEFTCYAIN